MKKLLTLCILACNLSYAAMSNIEKVELIKNGLMAGVDENFKHLISPDLTIQSPILDKITPQNQPSKTLVEVFAYWLRAFPTVESFWSSVDEDDQGNVIVNWEASAVHSGDDFMEIEAKNTSFDYSGTTTYTFANGKLIAYSAQVDVDRIVEQLK
ncbi:MAG: hypothetical protein MRY21_06610 [Simkaniaceae bacterium]|nr:hypothetical protein [Simkaniaceae bacterium]